MVETIIFIAAVVICLWLLILAVRHIPWLTAPFNSILIVLLILLAVYLILHRVGAI